MGEIVDIRLNPKSALKIIRDIAQNHSHRVRLEQALEKGMGDLAMSQIWKCLEEGEVSIDPALDDMGNIVLELSAIAAGDEVLLALSIEGKGARQIVRVLHAEEG